MFEAGTGVGTAQKLTRSASLIRNYSSFLLIGTVYCKYISVSESHNKYKMSHIENLKAFDPFADAAKGENEGVQDGLVHVRSVVST
jgi:hypothetical protein